MTPTQVIKRMILDKHAAWGNAAIGPLTPDEVDDRYEQLVESDEHYDAKNEIRCGQVESGLEAPSSRNFEAKSVAAKGHDGRWVGWTYWYGGGKHAEPEAIEWMEDAYFLDCVEEEKVVTVRTFTKTAQAAAN